MDPDYKSDAVKFLQAIGVDTRFVSIVGREVFINNQRFSRFSSKREESFKKNFPDFNVCRSMIFQKICTRASRVLANSIKPGDNVLIFENGESFILEVVMEPYTRKYGITIITDISSEDPKIHNANSIVSPITLDDEVENIVGNILNGEKIEPSHLKDRNGCDSGIKIIFPLLNVPRSWIFQWFEKIGREYNFAADEKMEGKTIKFFEGFIPDVRENILKSANHVFRESRNNE